MPDTEQHLTRKPDNSGAMTGFLIVAFAVVGLTGVFATFAAPLPLHRALMRDAALDDALAANFGPAPEAGLEALRARLGESADALLPAKGAALPADMPMRIARERVAMRARFMVQAQETDLRLRWLLGVITLTGAAFGVAALRMSRR
jgi:hypothetical protein